jgi:transcriptional regulator with XRE-family HTH domain
MEFLGIRLREERKRVGLSQEAFAALGCIEANAQLRYEHGRRLPRADYLALIGNGGADLRYIILGERRPIAAAELSGSERSLMQSYRSLLPADREAVGQITSSLSKRRGAG